MKPCERCREPHASFGIGPPIQEKQAWFCGACVTFHPYVQATLAKRTREALEDPEIKS